jgi:tRNA G10  N-methylase Trm11
MVHTKHPATYSNDVLDIFASIVKHDSCILDPFAGTGRIHEIARHDEGIITIGVEIEPEWARMHPCTTVGDATALRFCDDTFDYVCTSPAYGNRLADRYVPKDTDTSHRFTYRIGLGRDLDERNGGGMQWGPAYKELHAAAIDEMVRVVKPGGLIMVDIKDHSRGNVRQEVTKWWKDMLQLAGAPYVTRRRVGTGGLRHSGPVKVQHPQWVLVHMVNR